MKIIIIRHAPVQMKWERSYTSAGFDRACHEFDNSPIERNENIRQFIENRPVYCSTASRTLETADLLFGGLQPVSTPLLNEVPMRSFRDTERKLPLFVWYFTSRLQWFFGRKRQAETRSETRRRARELIALLTEKGEDCILISHGFFIQVLIRELKRAGFESRGGSLFGLSPLERIILTERTMHCGSCGHNCPLTRPGCVVGEEKASKLLSNEQRSERSLNG